LCYANNGEARTQVLKFPKVGVQFSSFSPEKDCARTTAIKPGLSPKLEAMIGFDDCGKNLPFGAENL